MFENKFFSFIIFFIIYDIFVIVCYIIKYEKLNKSNEFLFVELKIFNSCDSTNVYLCMRRWDQNCVNNKY